MRATLFIVIISVSLPFFQAAITIGSLANGKFVSAELGRDGRLRARADDAYEWEKFTIEDLGDDTYAFKAANGKYVSAELEWKGDSAGTLRARADSVGAWEKFKLTPNGDGHYSLQCATEKYVSAELGYSGEDIGLLRCRASVASGWEIFDIVL